jgi:hypothetical protein
MPHWPISAKRLALHAIHRDPATQSFVVPDMPDLKEQFVALENAAALLAQSPRHSGTAVALGMGLKDPVRSFVSDSKLNATESPKLFATEKEVP